MNDESRQIPEYLPGTGIFSTLAPEFKQNKYYDEKCDIWSIGYIMFHLLSG